MKAVIQRVIKAEVRVEGTLISKIDSGLLVFLAVHASDTTDAILPMAQKILGLRIFSNDKGKFDYSVKDIGGSILVVSQFTLYADCNKGRRPNFQAAADPTLAEQLYKKFIMAIAAQNVPVFGGKFQSHMEVSSINDGPVTIILE